MKHRFTTRRLLSLLACVFITISSYSQLRYTSPASGQAIINNATDWDAIAWVTSPSLDPPFVEYVIQPGYTIILGAGASNVDLKPKGDVSIIIAGKLGYVQGNGVIEMTLSSKVTVSPGGFIGFPAVSPANCCHGNQADRLVFGTGGSAVKYKGPWYVTGPDFINATNAPNSSSRWIGTTSSNWNTPSNWIPAAVPTSSNNVVIPNPADYVNAPQISTTGNQASAMTLMSGSVLTINGSGALSINDSIHNFGTFNVFSGGAFVQSPASASCDYCPSGTFNVERDLTGQVSPWYMGSPINSLSKAGFSGCGNGQYDPGSSCPAPALGSTSPCVMSLNQDNTTTSINCSHSLWNMESAGSFLNGQGYNIYNSPGILSFVGQTVNNGPVSYGPLGYSNKGPVNLPAGFAGQTTRGWHMVANPFPSPISLSSAQRTAMGFDAQTQFWDSDLGNWVTPAPGATVTVAVGQAFQIRTSGGPGNFANFAVNNSHRVATTGVAFYKTEDNQDYLNVTIANGNYANTASVYFVDGATDAFDGAYDANRLFGLVDRPYAYTIEQNGEFLAYNALPLLIAGTTKSVPLSVHIGTNGNHTLTFEGIETTNATVALEDLTTGSMYPVTEGYVHTFTAQTTDNPNRFVLHFNANAVSSVAGVSGQVVNMFPNPTNDKAVVVLTQEHGFNKLTVRDISGKVILSEAINANSTSKSIDLAGMASGIYFVTLSGKQIVSQKLIKQ